MSPWMKWMRTTLLSSLIMYSMLSRLITLSPTRSNLLMVHLLPPKSRAETPEGYPGPITYVASSAQRRRGLTPLFTQVRGIGILRTSPLRSSRKFTLKADPPLDHRFGRLSGSYRICVAVHYLLPPGCGLLQPFSERVNLFEK